MATVEVSRTELFDLVWQKPLQQVAAHYDADYWHIRQLCNDRDIPRPPKGYWNKVSAGKPLPPRPALQETSGRGNTVRIETGLSQRISAEGERRKEFTALLSKFADVRVPESLTSPHPLVKRLRDDFASFAKDGPVVPNPVARSIYEAPLTPALERRRLRILDTIFKKLEKLGFSIAMDHLQEVTASATDCLIRFRVREKLRQVRTLRPGQKVPRKGESYRGKYDIGLASAGVLEFSFGYSPYWTDTPEAQLETFLPEMLATFVSMRVRQAEHAKIERERAERFVTRQREAALKRERQEKEDAAFAKFLSAADNWHAVQKARAFLEELVAKDSIQNRSGYLKWLRRRINEMDPLRGDLSFIDEVAVVPDAS